ncbi:PilW family protein [Pseudomonas sp. X10]
MRRQLGFGLLEGLLALGLGLLLLAAASQVFVSAQQSWQFQGASARLQEDARLALQRLAQDLRMAGMYGCLSLEHSDFLDPVAAQAFAQPFQLSLDRDGRLLALTLVGGELPGAAGDPDWTVLTDCLTWAHVHPKRRAAVGDEIALPVRRQVYRLVGDSLRLGSGGSTAAIIDHVRDLRVSRVRLGEHERVDLLLTVFDPRQRIEQRYDLSVTLRNRLLGP